MDPQEIRDTILEIRRRRIAANETEDELRVLFPDFAGRYPRLFSSCCDVNFDISSHLDYMLNMLSSMKSDAINEKGATEAVYGRLNRAYLPPAAEDS
jgi:hypothetical protein